MLSEDLLDNILASSIVLAVFLLIVGVFFTVWTYLKARKKRQYFVEVHKELKPGQEVMFGGGIFGTVKEVEGDRVTVKVRSGAMLDVSRYAIQEIE